MKYHIIKKYKNTCKKEQVFFGMNGDSLIFLGQIYYNDCIVILDKNEINILKCFKLRLKKNREKVRSNRGHTHLKYIET